VRISPAAGAAPSLPTPNGGVPFQPVSPFGGSGTGGSTGSSDGGTGSVGSGPADAASIAKDVDPGVVDINTTVGYENARAAGTGMVLTSDGEILTNNHVISGATSISVTDVGNGKTYPASVVGYDKSHDVAVLQLQGASGLATITPASIPAGVGAGVVGVGNGGGAGGTPSYAGGVVTATAQTITASDSSDGTSEQLTGLLETNAAIVAGYSGGPLVNAQGKVVGMDTAASTGYRFNTTTQAYAIPIDDALQIARQIDSGAATSTTHIGPTAMLGVGIRPDASGGAVVAQVLDSGPAANAGLTAGDTIVAVAGQSVTSADDLSTVMLRQQPGDRASLSYLDGSGVRHTATVHLATGPPQ
jgi:S1-C subfamily serine protease